MKILYLVNIPSPYRVDFFNELGKLCDLTVLFEREYSKDRKKNWHNYNFNNFNGIILKGLNFIKNNSFNFGVIKYLKEEKYDCIVIGGYSTPTGLLAICYLKFKKIPFVLNVDGGIINYTEKKLIFFMKKFFISAASYWLSTGKSTTDYLTYYGAVKNNIYIYPFTTVSKKDIVDKKIKKLNKDDYKKMLSIPEKKIIISVGQFVHRKGFDILLQASKEISSETGVYIVGGQPTSEYLEIAQNQSNIHFIDFMDKDQLAEYYMASDLFVFPTREDIWGLVVNEAMSYGLPVITTDACIAGLELVKDYENGFIVPTNNALILSNKINEVLNDEILLENMSEKSYEKIQNYTLENMALITKKNLSKVIIRKKN